MLMGVSPSLFTRLCTQSLYQLYIKKLFPSSEAVYNWMNLYFRSWSHNGKISQREDRFIGKKEKLFTDTGVQLRGSRKSLSGQVPLLKLTLAFNQIYIAVLVPFIF